MESMNKFKVLTVIIICMFLFIVAAIYSNTKDASINKVQQKKLSTDYDKQKASLNNDVNVSELQNQIEFLNKRVDDLSVNSSSGLTCKIIGVSTGEEIFKLTQDEAIEEARNSGAEIVITCSL